MTRLLDVNVLLALAWPNHVHHGAARAWFEAEHAAGWATCGVTESGFIRVSSNRRVTPDARPPAEAALLLHRMCRTPGHEFLVDRVRLSESHEALGAIAPASSDVNDVHLIMIARDASAEFVTFDRQAASVASTLDVTATLLRM